MKHLDNDYKLNPQQSQYGVWELLGLVSAQPVKESSIVKHVGAVPVTCLNCPILQNELCCNQCNRWNQHE